MSVRLLLLWLHFLAATYTAEYCFPYWCDFKRGSWIDFLKTDKQMLNYVSVSHINQYLFFNVLHLQFLLAKCWLDVKVDDWFFAGWISGHMQDSRHSRWTWTSVSLQLNINRAQRTLTELKPVWQRNKGARNTALQAKTEAGLHVASEHSSSSKPWSVQRASLLLANWCKQWNGADASLHKRQRVPELHICASLCVD